MLQTPKAADHTLVADLREGGPRVEEDRSEVVGAVEDVDLGLAAHGSLLLDRVQIEDPVPVEVREQELELGVRAGFGERRRPARHQERAVEVGAVEDVDLGAAAAGPALFDDVDVLDAVAVEVAEQELEPVVGAGLAEGRRDVEQERAVYVLAAQDVRLCLTGVGAVAFDDPEVGHTVGVPGATIDGNASANAGGAAIAFGTTVLIIAWDVVQKIGCIGRIGL